jgi:hypothetical protein
MDEGTGRQTAKMLRKTKPSDFDETLIVHVRMGESARDESSGYVGGDDLVACGIGQFFEGGGARQCGRSSGEIIFRKRREKDPRRSV